ncbi:MAG: 50S ribosomal protein L32 [Acidobacteriota bacterium]|jgi:large subunit ribosomal protein L32
MPNPRRRHSKTRRDKRRTGDALSLPNLVECPQCHEKRPPHQVCPACGHYDGRAVLEVKET